MRWNRIETAHFTLFYDTRDRAQAETWSRRAEEDIARVTRDLNLPAPEGKFDFYLCPDVTSFMDQAGKTAEDYEPWMVGNADYEKRRLCVLSPRAVTDRPPEAMDQVVTHEIVHIAMDALRPGDECPPWLGEGVATLYAGQVWAESAEACPSIGELEEDFVGNRGYDYAGTYVWYLMERHGMERFKRLYAGTEEIAPLVYPGFERDAVTAWQAARRNPAG